MNVHAGSSESPATPSPPEPAGPQLDRLVELMRRLRAPDGCPWDREQTLQSLRVFVIEEAYEVVDAIDRGDLEALRDEIGDLVLEGVFLSQISAERGAFTLADAIRSVHDKLVRRHPHVFDRDRVDEGGEGRPLPGTAREVKARWAELKAREREGEGSTRRTLGGIPRTLPALLRAYEIGSRVAYVGFDWERAPDVLAKVDEEVRELGRVARERDKGRAEEEFGDLLFAIANLARKLGIEPESALRSANDKFSRRFAELERRLEAKGIAVHEAGLEAMEREWEAVKNVDG